jgi:hypothetical protein
MDELRYEPFDTLVLDKLYEVYRTNYEFGNDEVDVTIDVEMVKELDFLIDFLKEYEGWFENMIKTNDFKKLVNKKNGYWIELGDEKVTLDGMISATKLKKIEFMLFPYITLIYDNELFYGHDVVVEVDCLNFSSFSIDIK